MHVGADNRAMYASEEWLQVESLDLEGQGVAHRADGKVCSSRARCRASRRRSTCRGGKNQWEQAR